MLVSRLSGRATAVPYHVEIVLRKADISAPAAPAPRSQRRRASASATWVVVVFRRGGKAHLSNPAAKIDHVVRWPEGDGTLQFDATLYAKAQGFERKVFKCAVEEWDPVTKRRGPKQLAEFDVDIGALASKSLSTTTTFSSDKGGCITLQCRLDPLITSEAESEADPPKLAPRKSETVRRASFLASSLTHAIGGAVSHAATATATTAPPPAQHPPTHDASSSSAPPPPPPPPQPQPLLVEGIVPSSEPLVHAMPISVAERVTAPYYSDYHLRPSSGTCSDSAPTVPISWRAQGLREFRAHKLPELMNDQGWERDLIRDILCTSPSDGFVLHQGVVSPLTWKLQDMEAHCVQQHADTGPDAPAWQPEFLEQGLVRFLRKVQFQEQLSMKSWTRRDWALVRLTPRRVQVSILAVRIENDTIADASVSCEMLGHSWQSSAFDIHQATIFTPALSHVWEEKLGSELHLVVELEQNAWFERVCLAAGKYSMEIPPGASRSYHTIALFSAAIGSSLPWSIEIRIDIE